MIVAMYLINLNQFIIIKLILSSKQKNRLRIDPKRPLRPTSTTPTRRQRLLITRRVRHWQGQIAALGAAKPHDLQLRQHRRALSHHAKDSDEPSQVQLPELAQLVLDRQRGHAHVHGSTDALVAGEQGGHDVRRGGVQQRKHALRMVGQPDRHVLDWLRQIVVVDLEAGAVLAGHAFDAREIQRLVRVLAREGLYEPAEDAWDLGLHAGVFDPGEKGAGEVLHVDKWTLVFVVWSLRGLFIVRWMMAV